MRISTQHMDTKIQTTTAAPKVNVEQAKSIVKEPQTKATDDNQKQSKEVKLDAATKEKLTEAVTAINDFLEVEKKASKFVLHDGLDKYYVKLVDPETDEVIKEIPPESLLNAFYEMKKLAGMIVDEKI